MTLEYLGSNEAGSHTVEDAKTKEKVDTLDETAECPQPGIKGREKMEVRRPAGSFD